MIISTLNGREIDTERDLTAEERHILQKLMLWEQMVKSIEEFRRKKQEALLRGWNNSGPVRESENLHSIISAMEERIMERLSKGP